ncbi:MAG: response regulator [Clostridiaceae bacterium]|nr:response regulator [Clostridiaceae bacterium]
MFKALIIDDEEPVREAIKILGKWKEHGIGILLEASNGVEGMAIVEKEKPDLILVDMKMPKMNGFEFLKNVEKYNSEIQTIVVSGYDSYEYTRQAIQSKAADYLLKPVNREELNKAIENCINNIKEKQKEVKSKIDKEIILNLSLPAFKEKIFMSIIEGEFDKNDKELYLNRIDALGNVREYGAAIVRIMNMEELIKEKFRNNLQLMHTAISNVIDEICSEGMECYSFSNPNLDREFIIIISFTSYLDNKLNRIKDVITKLYLKIKELFGAKIAICIGESYIGIENIEKAYRASEKILDSINIFEMTEGIYSEELKREKGEIPSILTVTLPIKDALENGTLLYAKAALGDYLQKLEGSRQLNFKEAYRLLKEFGILLENMILEFKFLQTFNIKAGENINYDFSTFIEFKKAIYAILDCYFDKVKNYLKENRNFNIKKIKDYIDKNYYQDIKISSFADKYFLSKEYIMKLFKQEFNCGIHEYVQKVRMEKARLLLNDLDIKVQSVSQLVGFSDTNYFSKAFRNYYGISPTDYRNNLLGK